MFGVRVLLFGLSLGLMYNFSVWILMSIYILYKSTNAHQDLFSMLEYSVPTGTIRGLENLLEVNFVTTQSTEHTLHMVDT